LRFGETRHRTGLRGDVADLDDEIVGAQDRGSKHRTRRKRRRAGLEHVAAGRLDHQQRAPLPADERVFFHRYVLPVWQTVLAVRCADLVFAHWRDFHALIVRTLRRPTASHDRQNIPIFEGCRRQRAGISRALRHPSAARLRKRKKGGPIVSRSGPIPKFYGRRFGVGASLNGEP
jgi:hypothetical protein